MMDQFSYVKFLRTLADAVERMSGQEFKDFISGNSEAALRKSDSSKRHRAGGLNEAAVAEIINSLQSLKSRDEGMEALKRLDLSRSELAIVARARNLHVMKEDKISRIQEKLVEAIIGSRLSSQAIRGDVPSGKQ